MVSTILASQVILVVKNLPANAGDIRDMGSIPGLEDPLKGEMATHSGYLCLKNSRNRGAWQMTVHGITKNQTQLSD